MQITRHLKGGTSATVTAELGMAFVPPRNQNGRWGWLNVVTRDQQDLEVTNGSVIKQDLARDGITSIESHILKEYHSRGYEVPKVIENEDTLSMQYVPGLTLLEEFTFDPNLTIGSVISRLTQMHRVVRKMDRELPDILDNDQINFFKRLEREKLRKLGIDDVEAETNPYSQKIAARTAQIGLPLDIDAVTALTHLEDLFKPYLARHGQLFVEANGKNIIGETRMDMNGVFEGFGDSFLLDTPYLPTDTFWVQRISRADVFQPNYTAVENAKTALILEKAEEEHKDPNELLLAFQISRVYRNNLEMVHNYKLALEKKEEAQSGELTSQMRMFQYLSNLTAHYEMANTGMSIVLNLWPRIGINKEDNQFRHKFRELQQTAKGYFQGMEQLHRQMAETLGVTEHTFLGKCLDYFKYFRDPGDYSQFKKNGVQEL